MTQHNFTDNLFEVMYSDNGTLDDIVDVIANARDEFGTSSHEYEVLDTLITSILGDEVSEDIDELEEFDAQGETMSDEELEEFLDAYMNGEFEDVEFYELDDDDDEFEDEYELFEFEQNPYENATLYECESRLPHDVLGDPIVNVVYDLYGTHNPDDCVIDTVPLSDIAYGYVADEPVALHYLLSIVDAETGAVYFGNPYGVSDKALWYDPYDLLGYCLKAWEHEQELARQAFSIS